MIIYIFVYMCKVRVQSETDTYCYLENVTIIAYHKRHLKTYGCLAVTIKE